MQQVPVRVPVFRFGVFEVDIACGELRKQGVLIRLQGQPFQILVMFLERSGELVTRDEIRRKLWPPDTYIDFEQGLGTAIKKLRHALGDDAERPHYIETLPKRGYRFIAHVERPSDPGPPDPLPSPPTIANVRSRSSWIVAAVVIVLTGVLVAAVAFWDRESPLPGTEPPLAAVPLTTYPGIESSPSFSPDGNQVAFSWDGETRNNFDIYVKPVGSGPPLRLTADPAADVNPAWSPDGRSIAFHRLLPDNRAAIIEIPALGGPERLLAEISIPPSSPFGPFSSWYSDSQWLAASDLVGRSIGGTDTYGIYLISRETGERRLLTRPPAGVIGDSSPALSPDGQSLAFIRSAGHGLGDLYVVRISPQLGTKGRPNQVTFANSPIVKPAWTADGSSIIFGIDKNVGSLWRVPALGGKVERLVSGAEVGQTPAVSMRGNRFAFSRRTFDTNIWHTEISSERDEAFSAKTVAPSTWMEWDARFSPDGKKIAFASDRSGSSEIWVCDSTGSNAAELTSLGGAGLGSPRWSPDGQTLVFDSAIQGQWDVYAVAVHGGQLRSITSDPSNEQVPQWSEDGKYIYFASDRTGQFQVWKVPATGGQRVQVTQHGGYSAFESSDGQTLYYSKQMPGDQTSIWRVSVRGGPERMMVKSIYKRNFDVSSSGIYFVPRTAEPPFMLRLLSFRTNVVSDVLRLNQQLYSTLSVSPDEKSLLYSTIDKEDSDLMLVEKFH